MVEKVEKQLPSSFNEHLPFVESEALQVGLIMQHNLAQPIYIWSLVSNEKIMVFIIGLSKHYLYKWKDLKRENIAMIIWKNKMDTPSS